jgi:hypothetical protein
MYVLFILRTSIRNLWIYYKNIYVADYFDKNSVHLTEQIATNKFEYSHKCLFHPFIALPSFVGFSQFQHRC